MKNLRCLISAWWWPDFISRAGTSEAVLLRSRYLKQHGALQHRKGDLPVDDADNSAGPEVSPLWVPLPLTQPLHGTVVTTVLCLTQAGGTRSSIKSTLGCHSA